MDGEKLATPLLAQVTVPVGEAPPFTVAVHTVGELTMTVAGEQLTPVAVTAFATEREKLPEL